MSRTDQGVPSVCWLLVSRVEVSAPLGRTSGGHVSRQAALEDLVSKAVLSYPTGIDFAEVKGAEASMWRGDQVITRPDTARM